MGNDWNLVELGDWGVLRLRGPDGVRFLQGQVSSNVERLSPEQSQLAGYHNPQGRAIALLRLVQLAPDDLLAILPRELTGPVAGRLAKFVLRAKVKITEESESWRLAGLIAPAERPVAHESRSSGSEQPATSESQTTGTHTGAAGSAADNPEGAQAGASGAPGLEGAFESSARSWAGAQFEEANALATTVEERSSAAAQLEEDSVVELPTASALMLPDIANAQTCSGTTVVIRVGVRQARWLVISPAGKTPALSGCVAAARDCWRLLDIADGMPQVYAATSEEFVAQMLNLDALGAIAFDKGCYTGQEVIARAHYRGRVKRRLQRFMSRAPEPLKIGDSGILVDGRTFKVVDAARLANGRCEFLAVLALPGETAEGSSDTVGSTSGEAPNTGQAGRLEVDALPLPYPLPE
jgi:folate-binding protein YgfZ